MCSAMLICGVSKDVRHNLVRYHRLVLCVRRAVLERALLLVADGAVHEQHGEEGRVEERQRAVRADAGEQAPRPSGLLTAWAGVQSQHRAEATTEATTTRRPSISGPLGLISATSRLPLGYLSATSRLPLGYLSATSRLHLCYISATSLLHLGYISATSRLHLGRELEEVLRVPRDAPPAGDEEQARVARELACSLVEMD